MTFTETEALEALAEAMQGIVTATPSDAPGYFTVNEIAAAIDRHPRMVRVKLNKVRATGRLDTRHVRRPAIDGRNALVPAYRILPASP